MTMNFSESTAEFLERSNQTDEAGNRLGNEYGPKQWAFSIRKLVVDDVFAAETFAVFLLKNDGFFLFVSIDVLSWPI